MGEVDVEKCRGKGLGTEAEIEDAIASAMSETGATSVKQMGAVMKAAQAKLAGKRVDGKALSDRVRSKLT